LLRFPCRTLGPFFGKHFKCLTFGYLFRCRTARYGYVGSAVGNIGTKPAVFNDDFFARRRVVTEFRQWRFCLTSSSSLLRLCVDFFGLSQRDGKELFFRL